MQIFQIINQLTPEIIFRIKKVDITLSIAAVEIASQLQVAVVDRIGLQAPITGLSAKFEGKWL